MTFQLFPHIITSSWTHTAIIGASATILKKLPRTYQIWLNYYYFAQVCPGRCLYFWRRSERIRLGQIYWFGAGQNHLMMMMMMMVTATATSVEDQFQCGVLHAIKRSIPILSSRRDEVEAVESDNNECRLLWGSSSGTGGGLFTLNNL